MKNKKFRYKNIFLYASLQFCGNIEEYFVNNTEKLVVFIVQPRIKNKDNLLRVYNKGTLVKEQNITLHENIFLNIFLWYTYHIKFLFTYFSRKDNVVVITSALPLLFGMTFQKLFMNVRYVFWTEYFPTINLTYRLFHKVKNFYHTNIDFGCYFGDEVNKLMNGKILDTKTKRTILWGVKPKLVKKRFPTGKMTMLFVGLIKESQGLELVFKYLKKHKNYDLNIIGVCDDKLYAKYKKIFVEYDIAEQVYFPNKFIFEDKLQEISKECFVGLAPYTTGKINGTYYIDPGKIKAYAEMGLPIIMSNTSAIAPYVKKFSCGEIIERNENDLDQAILKIIGNYKQYLEGLKKFNKYFYYEDYYAKKFDFLESPK